MDELNDWIARAQEIIEQFDADCTKQRPSAEYVARLKEAIAQAEANTVTLWLSTDDDEEEIDIYRNKPTRHNGFFDDGDFLGKLSIRVFPHLTFENSPKQVELKLIGE